MVNNNNQHNTNIFEHQTPKAKTRQQQRPMEIYIVILIVLRCDYFKYFPVYLFKT